MTHSPSDPILAWAVDVLCRSGQLVDVRELHDVVGPWLVRCTNADKSVVCSGILRLANDDKDASYVRTEAAALQTLDQCGIAAPQLLGLDSEGRESGRAASLQSVLTGEPINSSPYSPARLRSLGAVLATVHAVSVEPSPELPTRERAMDGGGWLDERHRYAGSRRWKAGEQLLREAQDTLNRHPRPADRVGLVHGDAGQGNAMADDDRCTGLFDWGCAGVGHPGVDVGHTRLTAYLNYGRHAAADDVLAGWETETGEPLRSIPYWDTVAALGTPPDIGGPTDRRDAFLLRALEAMQL